MREPNYGNTLLPNGKDAIRDYHYRGVMAQHVLKVMPEAVSVGSDGYLRVDYDMIGIPLMRRLKSGGNWEIVPKLEIPGFEFRHPVMNRVARRMRGGVG